MVSGSVTKRQPNSQVSVLKPAAFRLPLSAFRFPLSESSRSQAISDIPQGLPRRSSPSGSESGKR